jgi:peptide/nickel transport system substrate-binding protein
VEGDLAEKWDVSADGLTWTFTLRPDMKFCDGTPVTAEDWVWSYDRARNPDNGIWSFTLEAIDKIEATDKTVVFKLKTPYVPFIYSPPLFNAVVMPKKLVEAAGGWEKFREHPCGTGPYIMKEWVKGDHMLLVRNPYYWEKGKPTIDEIMIKTITDDNTRILALQKGDVDAINYPPFNRVVELGTDPNMTVMKFPSTQSIYITLNNRNKPFDDKRVRAALAFAIDREALIKTVNFGIGVPATSFRPVGSLYFNDALPGWSYDVEKAKALLKEAGYESGFKTIFAIVAGSASDQQVATMVKDMWAKIGVDAEIQIQEAGLYNDEYYNNKYIAQINGWTDDIPDPSEETNYAVVNATSECYHTGYKNAEIDQLAADALKETDPAKREKMYKRIQEIFNADVPFIPLYNVPLVVVVNKNVQNFFQTSLGTYIWRDMDITK